MGGFLSGLTVLDLSAVGPASRASRWLADYGASVVKVSPLLSSRSPEETLYHYAGKRGMRTLQIDLKTPAGVAAFHRLASRFDVLLESFRPGVADRLGISYDAIRRRNKRIVYCSTSGYGQTGLRSQHVGHDLNYLSVGGFMACTGRGPADAPALPGTTVADTAAGGMHAVIAILAAIVQRQTTGTGAYLDVAVTDGVLALMSLQIDQYLATGKEPQPGEGILLGQYACYSTYRTADGRWLSVAAIEHRFWANLCRALNHEQWIEQQYTVERQEEIRDSLARVFASRDRDSWTRSLPGQDTCIAPVLSISEVVRDKRVLERDLIGEANHPQLGRVRQLFPSLAGTVRPNGVPTLPGADTDTDSLLAEAGLTQQEISSLRESGVVA